MATCSSVVNSFLGVGLGMVSMGRDSSSAEYRRSSSERYELASAPDERHDLYGLGSQLELLLSRRMVVAENSSGDDVLLEELLSDLWSGCDVGEAFMSARYALVGAYE